MLTPHNIKKFEKVTAEIFKTLYLAFPVPVTLSLETIFGITHPHDDYNQVENDEENFIHNTIDWLREEGYIRVGGYKFDLTFVTFSNVVLTAKAFEAMHSIPKILNTGKTIGEILEEALQSGITSEIENAVHLVISKGISLISASY